MVLRQLELDCDVNSYDSTSRYDASIIDPRIIALGKQMEDALARQEGLEYFKVVNSLGLEPTDRGLYERGAADAGVRDGSFSQRYPNPPNLTQEARLVLGKHFGRGLRHAVD
jgi:hypothetical protein